MASSLLLPLPSPPFVQPRRSTRRQIQLYRTLSHFKQTRIPYKIEFGRSSTSLDIRRTSQDGNLNVADFPSFATSSARPPAALANYPPFPSVILCMAVPKGISVEIDSSFLSIKTPSQTSWTILAGDASVGERNADDESEGVVVGEDSAAFDLGEQSVASWFYFTIILGVVLLVLNVVWINPSTGFGTAFVDAVASLSESHEVVMLALILIFAMVHSGMASLREPAEKIMGERTYRVLFAGVSLPLAVSTIVYFINHRYDGIQLWQLQGVPGIHSFVWLSNFISFFFLYPSTFNLLEVAAVVKPKLHLWESGIMRITRHPQMVGQVIWCLAHTLWIGNSVVLAASIGLIGHHLFGVWNGDRRLAARYGQAFDVLKSRTSILPFAAILDGRQKLPKDYYKEFIRLPYLSIIILTIGAYLAHPLMQASSYGLHW